MDTHVRIESALLDHQRSMWLCRQSLTVSLPCFRKFARTRLLFIVRQTNWPKAIRTTIGTSWPVRSSTTNGTRFVNCTYIGIGAKSPAPSIRSTANDSPLKCILWTKNWITTVNAINWSCSAPCSRSALAASFHWPPLVFHFMSFRSLIQLRLPLPVATLSLLRPGPSFSSPPPAQSDRKTQLVFWRTHRIDFTVDSYERQRDDGGSRSEQKHCRRFAAWHESLLLVRRIVDHSELRRERTLDRVQGNSGNQRRTGFERLSLLTLSALTQQHEPTTINYLFFFFRITCAARQTAFCFDLVSTRRRPVRLGSTHQHTIDTWQLSAIRLNHKEKANVRMSQQLNHRLIINVDPSGSASSVRLHVLCLLLAFVLLVANQRRHASCFFWKEKEKDKLK